MKNTVVIILLTLVPASLLAIKADFLFTKVCVGSQTMLYSTSTPADSIFQVLWDLNGDGKFNDDIGDTVFTSFSSPGLFNVGVKVISLDGDQDAIYKSVPVTFLNVAFTQDFTCRNRPVHFYDRTEIIADTAFQYIWNFGDGTTGSYLRNPTHNYNSAGQYVVRLIVISTVGCIDSATTILDIHNPPFVDLSFSGDTVFQLGDSIIVSVVGTFDSVFWSTGDRTMSVTIKESGYYFVQGFLDGCFGENSFHVTAVEDHTIRIMTLITPNGDGFNDRWEIFNISEIEPCQVEVYNRWGQKVFSASPYNNDWNGTDQGRALSNDTYYYFIRGKDGTLRKGTINIVK